MSKNEVKDSLRFYPINTNKLFVLFIAVSPMVNIVWNTVFSGLRTWSDNTEFTHKYYVVWRNTWLNKDAVSTFNLYYLEFPMEYVLFLFPFLY